ncbi:MAG: 4Fe-4S binding protein [Dehalococcoidia bacterium]|nr:MAG: 4Fe-4S binding protein [Dehalococcoidia bacterium]
MTTKVMRKIVRIDEEKCDGCGCCVPACAEGALQIIDGKAKLVGEIYCDGLGACLGECPQDAITIEEREAEEFDEVAVEHHLHSMQQPEEQLPCGCPSTTVRQFEQTAPFSGCPSANVARFTRPEGSVAATAETGRQESLLGHWPVQLTLVPPTAPFLRGADVVLAADCVPFAYPEFHRDFLNDRALLVACPKLDDYQAHLGKLIEILRQPEPKSLRVVHMEVPCCSGLVQMARQAIAASGRDIPFNEVTVGIRGELLS